MFICSLFVEVFLLHRTIKWIIAAALILSLCGSMEATAKMKNGEECDLTARLAAEPTFGMSEFQSILVH